MDDQPRVLFVDDEPGRLTGLRAQLDQQGIATSASHPVDLELSDLEGADLISVDQYLGDDWDEYLIGTADSISAATRASDGIAVAAAINSQVRKRTRPCALSIHTAEIDRLGASLSLAQREPLLAAQYDLDWVFRFDGSASKVLSRRMRLLSLAIASLPTTWSAVSDDFGAEWLGLPRDKEWSSFALAQIEDCRPPTHGLSANTQGRAVVRWLAQRVLPYPTYLIDLAHAAVLVGATKASVLDNLVVFSAVAYHGPLDDFLGPRWWRAGIQQILDDCGVSEADNPVDRVAALNLTLSTSLVALGYERPVVAYDGQGLPVEDPIDSTSAVRLQPDGWPVFADDPWATRDEAIGDASLRALVVHAERQTLSTS